MRKFFLKQMIFSFALVFSDISYGQNVDSTAKSQFATLFIYYPKGDVVGSFNVYLDDSIVCRAKYNSIHQVKLYKEGKIVLWVKPQKENSVTIDVRFGQEYFLECKLIKKESSLKPEVLLVTAVHGNYECNSMKADKARIKAKKDSLVEVKRLDTISRKNTFYAELGGPAIIYSLNYDRIFRTTKKVKNSVSLGLEVIDLFFGYQRKFSFGMIMPFSYNFLFGKKSNKIELGIGPAMYFGRYYYTYWNTFPDPDGYYSRTYVLFIFPKIGWRFQQKRGGLFFRANFTPVINVFYYRAREVLLSTNELISPASYGFFDYALGPGSSTVWPWAGISLGYTFNFKKKKQATL